MKTPILAIIVLMVAGWAVAGVSEINLNDNEAAVRAVLGAPKGHLRAGSMTVLYFDRGKVVLDNDRVTEFELVSMEEAMERIRIAKARAAEERLRRMNAGLALQAEKLADPVFLASTAADQLAFWHDFHRHYPGVPLESVDLAALSVRAAEQKREDDLRQERAHMQKRLQEAEARAREAERAAQRAESQASYHTVRYYDNYWPVTTVRTTPSYCPPPIIHKPVIRSERHHTVKRAPIYVPKLRIGFTTGVRFQFRAPTRSVASCRSRSFGHRRR